jgi:hypothetical protein
MTVAQLVKKFPALYGTQRFIPVFTTAHHRSVSWARWIQSTTSHHIYSTLMSFRPLLILSNVLFTQIFPTKIVYVFLVSPMHATCNAHLVLLAFIALIIFGEGYNLLNHDSVSSRFEPMVFWMLTTVRSSSWRFGRTSLHAHTVDVCLLQYHRPVIFRPKKRYKCRRSNCYWFPIFISSFKHVACSRL